MKKISVVVPVYNGEKSLYELVERLDKVLSSFACYELILVNDFSADNSLAVIKELALNYQYITTVNVIENVGQQQATLLGLKEANGDYVVVIDDDLENNPEDITELITELEKGYDVVYALRNDENDKGFVRAIGSNLRNVVFRVFTKLPKNKRVCSFRIMRRSIVDQIKDNQKSFVYLSMEILKVTDKVGNIMVSYNSNSQSNYSLGSLIKLYFKIILHYSFLNILVSKEKPSLNYEVVRGKQYE